MRAAAVTTVSVMALSLAWQAAAVTWISPSLPQPGGNVAPPLNTSAAPQTKRGGLTIQGTAIIPSPKSLTIGTVAGQSRICWNGVCLSNWSEVGQASGYLRLQTDLPTSPDTGYVNLEGVSSATAPAAISGTAGAPAFFTPTYGVLGEASSAPGISYGLYALASGVGTQQFAVFAYNAGLINAWAGYFSGRVAISNAGAEGFDLTIGTSPPANGPGSNDPSRSEICLGGYCRFDWPVVSGSGFWSLVGSEIRPKTAGRSVAASGIGGVAPFRVDVAIDGGGNPINAALNVAGGGQFEQYVVGAPVGSSTCGDGICTAPECDGDPPGCPVARLCKPDCDITPPQNVLLLKDSLPFEECDPLYIPPPPEESTCIVLGPP
ncbi:MAG: hypothetical protein HY421_03180, partial [Candidatus Kerfeldbacteria bacterium]|nr:hypothetical protein [Candidatus Kerfeldbacteria bacterium]